jgi:hypothetical protein
VADPPRDPLDLELEKWRFERECRERELALKEREQTNKDAELELRRREQRAATWRSPLTVAIFAAAVAGISNAGVALVNGSLQRDLDRGKREAEINLEKTKSESNRILEMIKTGDSEKAAGNLDFLLSSGLVTDDEIRKKLTTYLAARTPGSGPALPSPTRVAIDESTPIERPLKELLEKQLGEYLAFLDKIGFPPSKQKVVVQMDSTKMNNAYYDGRNNRIVIDQRVADDPTVPLREYTHHVLMSAGRESLMWDGQFAAIESGLADYFACSFLDRSKLGEKAAKVWGIGPYIRTLDNRRSFAEFSKLPRDASLPHAGAEIWGGLFWSLRTQLGRAEADQILAAAWLGFDVPKPEASRAPAFAQRLVDESRKRGESQHQTTLATLRDRQFPTPR